MGVLECVDAVLEEDIGPLRGEARIDGEVGGEVIAALLTLPILERSRSSEEVVV